MTQVLPSVIFEVNSEKNCRYFWHVKIFKLKKSNKNDPTSNVMKERSRFVKYAFCFEQMYTN